MATKPQPDFKLYPGIGYLFREGGPKTHPLFRGQLAIGDNEYQLKGFYDVNSGEYKLDVREFQTWTTRASLTLSKPKRDGKRRGKFELDGKPYWAEAVKGETAEGKPCVHIRVPKALVRPSDVY